MTKGKKALDLGAIAIRLNEFALQRDWEQFHSPKNLAMALSVEVAELLEIFQWLTEKQSRDLSAEAKEKASEELADVLLYLIQLSSKLNVDLSAAVEKKLSLNAEKYPVEKARGSARKYTELK